MSIQLNLIKTGYTSEFREEELKKIFEDIIDLDIPRECKEMIFKIRDEKLLQARKRFPKAFILSLDSMFPFILPVRIQDIEERCLDIYNNPEKWSGLYFHESPCNQRSARETFLHELSGMIITGTEKNFSFGIAEVAEQRHDTGNFGDILKMITDHLKFSNTKYTVEYKERENYKPTRNLNGNKPRYDVSVSYHD